MNRRGNANLGDEIKNIVQDAVNNRDFNRLNRDIGNVVNSALDEVRRSIIRKREDHNWSNQTWNHRTWNNHTWNNHTWNNQTGKANDDQNRNVNPSQTWKAEQPKKPKYNNNNLKHNNNAFKPVPIPTRFAVPVGQVSNILFIVFGAIISSVCGLAIIVMAILGHLIEIGSVFHTIALGLSPLFLVGMVMCMNGSRIRKRLKRYRRYLSQMHGRNYCLIKELSSVTGLSSKSTVKDLRKMIAIGMFPEGHIDDKKTCFMLNSESYGQYLTLQENMRIREQEERAKQKDNTKQHGSAMQTDTSQSQVQEEINHENDSLAPEIRKAINEGRQFVLKIKNANIAIPGEEISRKLDRLEAVTGKIFDYVENHPDKFPEIKKFTEYFLPTTLKLLDAYREFDYQPVEGENISSAKREIEETMDTINLAFENLLDGLFEDVAMDVSTDISVLETMFAQEGLTEKNIRE